MYSKNAFLDASLSSNLVSLEKKTQKEIQSSCWSSSVDDVKQHLNIRVDQYKIGWYLTLPCNNDLKQMVNHQIVSESPPGGIRTSNICQYLSKYLSCIRSNVPPFAIHIIIVDFERLDFAFLRYICDNKYSSEKLVFLV